MEEWRDIPGFPGYQVSNQGRIRTHNKVTSSARYPVRHWADRIISQKVHHKDHYSRVDLWNDGKPHTLLVHRLVAQAFIPAYDNGLTVNHKDGNKSNNTTENLEWVSLGDNIRHAFENEIYTNQKSCILEDANGNLIRFRSQAQASRFLGKREGYVNECLKHGRKPVSASGMRYFFA